MARARLVGNGPITLLDATSLAHEAYLRLRNAHHIDIEDRTHFLAYVAQVMRSIIVDFARRRTAARRGGAQVHISLDTDLAEALSNADRQVELVDDALKVLEKSDPRLMRVVEMRYFGGMDDAEIAAVLGLTKRTVSRDLVRARLLLSVELKS
jgi:RNA polymerase sigma factor (TIGR02999 family)